MKTIMVTGASGDVGSSIVTELHKMGYRILAVVRNNKNNSRIENLSNVTIHIADVSNHEDLLSLKKSVLTVSENIDWIITAHGFIDSQTELELQKSEDIEETFRVNTISLIYIAQLFLKNITSGMLFISSTQGIRANGRYAAYSASKAGVNSLAVAFALNRPTLTFISLCPGPIAGRMRKHAGATGGQDPSVVAKTVADIIAPNTTYKSGDIVSVLDGKITIESRMN